MWDAGGGSMQIIARNARGTLDIYGNELGFIPFTHLVIKTVQHKKVTPTDSPNPLSEEQASQAICKATDYTKNIPDFIEKKLPTLQLKLSLSALCTMLLTVIP